MSIIQAAIIGSAAGSSERDRPDPHTGTWEDTLIVSSGVRGTAYDPGGGVVAVENATEGLWRRHYTGNWSSGGNIDNINFFSGGSSVYELADTYVSFGNRNLTDKSNYAFEWLGYIYCDSTDTYNFAVNVDDYARVWIGDVAIRGYNNSNAVVVASNGVGVSTNSVILTSGYYYPVRIWFQEISGAETMQVYFGHSDGPFLTSMNQHPLWYNSATTGFNTHIFPTPGTGSYNANNGSSTLVGTAYDPGGAQDSVDNSAYGFYRRTVLGEWYNGSYGATDMAFFDGKTVLDYRPDAYVGFGSQADLQTQYSMYWLGYFQAPTTGTYNLSIDSDDQSMVWIGSTAVSGFNASNWVVTVNNGINNSVSLIGGKWYPIRIWYDEHLGNDRCQLYIGQTGGTYYSMNYWYQQNRIAYNTVTNGLNLTPRVNATSFNSWTGLTMVGNPTNNGTYVSFDGTNQYATSAGLVNANPSPSFTVEMWARIPSDNGVLVGDGAAGTGYNSTLLEVVNNDMVAGYYHGTGAVSGTVVTNIDRTNWHHYVYAYNSAGPHLEFFVDGNRVMNLNLASKIGSGPELDLFRGGYGTYFGDNTSLAGDLGEFRVWDGLLSDAKVLAQYNATKSTYQVPRSYSFASDTPDMSMSPGYAFGTGAFTIQGWAKFTSSVSGGLVSSNGTVGSMVCGFVSSTSFFIYIPGTGPTATFTISPAITTGSWHHFALVRDGSGHLALFIDGSRTGYDANHSSNYSVASDYLFNGLGAIGPWDTAKLADFQVSNTNLYDPTQTTITVPTAKLTATAGVTKLLLDGAINTTTDAAGVQTITPLVGTITLNSDFPV
jgi:hypothetical protein